MIALIGLDLNKQQSFDKELSAIQGSEIIKLRGKQCRVME